MPTIDERIEAARKLEGYTPGPWCVSPTDDTTIIALDRSVVAEIDGDYNEPDLWPIMEANARVVAAAPDLHRLALDLAAERERLLALALKAFTVVEWVVGEGYLLEAPHEDADDLLLEMVDALGVESSDEARAALAAAPAPQPTPQSNATPAYGRCCGRRDAAMRLVSPALRDTVADLIVIAEAQAKRIEAIVAAYDREVFMRSADEHPENCGCLRCEIDRARAALNQENYNDNS